MDAFSKAVSRNHLLEKYKKKISGLEQKIGVLTEQINKLKHFVALNGLGEAFGEYVRSLALKTMRQRLEDARLEADVHNSQRKLVERGRREKSKQWRQEM